jgi:uncharacterized protein YdeI (YjbR/CyaY-like superfamily)
MARSRPDAATDEVLFFATPPEFRAWLLKHHGARSEQWVGFYKKGSGRPSITWPESVDEALCVGWIDGVRKSIDEESYKIRFTPRKAVSHWSAVNIDRVEELTRERRMQPAGLEAFARRTEAKSRKASYENPEAVVAFSPDEERRFRAAAEAWNFFEAQAPWYRRLSIWRVVTAKKPETRERRMAKLIAASAAGRRT